MKLLVEVEILPQPGWRLLTPAEIDLFEGTTYITDAPENYLMIPDDELYSLQIFEPWDMGQNVGEWLRNGCSHFRERYVTVGSIIQHKIKE